MNEPCEYCLKADCPDLAAHIEYARRTRAMDRAAFAHFNPHLVGKSPDLLGKSVRYDSIAGREKQVRMG